MGERSKRVRLDQLKKRNGSRKSKVILREGGGEKIYRDEVIERKYRNDFSEEPLKRELGEAQTRKKKKL